MARILVVDDKNGPLGHACDVLRLDLGHEVTGVLKTTEALAIVGNGFDLVVSDKDMPDGGAIKILEANLGIPVIVISGRFQSPDDGERRRMLIAGAFATVSKFDTNVELTAAVATALSCQTPLETGQMVMANCYKCDGMQFMVMLGRQEALIPGFCGGQMLKLGRMQWTTAGAPTGTTFDIDRTVTSAGCKCPLCGTTYAQVVAIYDPTYGPQVFLYESEGA